MGAALGPESSWTCCEPLDPLLLLEVSMVVSPENERGGPIRSCTLSADLARWAPPVRGAGQMRHWHPTLSAVPTDQLQQDPQPRGPKHSYLFMRRARN